VYVWSKVGWLAIQCPSMAKSLAMPLSRARSNSTIVIRLSASAQTILIKTTDAKGKCSQEILQDSVVSGTVLASNYMFTALVIIIMMNIVIMGVL